MTRDIETEEIIPDLLEVGGRQSSIDKGPLDEVKVPITIITGYLGAGKTTLLNYILKAQHGQRIAVILNEFGDSADIEKALTVSDPGSSAASSSTETWLPLANGCLCCTVKDSGVLAIESLMEQRGAFDYILLETTGLADPGRIAPLFWLDDGLGATIYLDGVVTVVDALNVLKSLDEDPPAASENESRGASIDHDTGDEKHMTTAHLQISHADRIIINKIDLVDKNQADAVEARIRSINGLAGIIRTERANLPSLKGTILDLHAYEGLGEIDWEKGGHSHLDPTIATFVFPLPPISASQLPLLRAWLDLLLWERSLLGEDEKSGRPEQDTGKMEVHRLKGIVRLTDGSARMIQGVRDVYDITELAIASEVDSGKLVIIGRGMNSLETQGRVASSLLRALK